MTEREFRLIDDALDRVFDKLADRFADIDARLTALESKPKKPPATVHRLQVINGGAK